MSTLDPYQILGVPKSATQDQIKKAYRDLAKRFHPDLNPGSKEAERKFKDINDAYGKIGTPENRAKFDRGDFDEAQFGGGHQQRGPFYRQTQRPGSQGSGGFEGGRYTYSFGEGMDEDLFASIFGGLGGRGMGEGPRARARSGLAGEDLLYRMEVDLKDVVLGGEKEIAIPTGKRLSVKIPPGVNDGTRLRFSGQGNPGVNGGPPGDAYIEIKVREDSRFQKRGEDLLYDLPISLPEAVFGAEIRVPTLSGEVLLRVPPHSNTGTRLRLPGKGLFNRANQKRGDQIVELKVVLPETIDSEFESALKRWQERHPYNPRERKAA